MAKNYYKILGVDKKASKEEIKRAFRRMARKYHPDVNPNDKTAEEKFKDINEAYAVLSDDKQREIYDRFGTVKGVPFQGAPGTQSSPGHGYYYQTSSGPVNFDFSEIFNRSGRKSASNFDFFNDLGDIFDVFSNRRSGSNRPHARRPMPGDDLRYDMEVSFEEAYFGGSRTIKFKRFETCPACNGTGAKDGKINTCPTCRGSGQIQQIKNTPFGKTIKASICPQCNGTGHNAANPCPVCHGTEKVEKVRQLTVKIPPGVKTGTKLRMPGEGMPGTHGGSPGDLYIVIRVKPHSYFQREGDNIIYNTSISYTQAVLGGKIKVPTMEGEVTLTIPPGTKSGTKLRLRGKGFKRLNRPTRGNQLVKIMIRVPKTINIHQKQLLEQLAATGI
ncbi:MAG: molecular chaperone DnaJ [Candidatus Helarchaeota archaeon]